MICKYFPPISLVVFYFVDGFLYCTEGFWFNVVSFVYFCFAFGVKLKKKIIANTDIKLTPCVFI